MFPGLAAADNGLYGNYNYTVNYSKTINFSYYKTAFGTVKATEYVIFATVLFELLTDTL